MSQYFATYNPTGVFTTSTITDYIGFDDTGEQTGKIPALVAVDLMDYSPSRVEYQGDIATTVEDGLEHAARGGIVSVLWHWNAPTGCMCLFNDYETD